MSGDVVPRTRRWKAVLETADIARILHVTGEIELGNTDEMPHLGLRDPRGTDPNMLNLDLEITISGPSELTMHWAGVQFSWPAPGRSPPRVRVMRMGVEVAFLLVTELDFGQSAAGCLGITRAVRSRAGKRPRSHGRPRQPGPATVTRSESSRLAGRHAGRDYSRCPVHMVSVQNSFGALRRAGGCCPLVSGDGQSRAACRSRYEIVEHRPEACACCGGRLHAALPAEVVSTREQIELPEVAPIVARHRRLAVRCPNLRDAGRRTGAGGGTRHSVRTTAARGGDGPQDLSGALV
ncbi:hypothetical protein OPKNFCMD_6611 [Methylobacterium crusticola]|uniref:Transposase IS66 zinc-finger binding domain-containing protein n=1 Tax=Methylobacterium crusticola TaxID=1697972 RepID=A0ABQ4R7Y0_9HYPH|nr:hypothetical protein OPKNFCMD_6611 [Methylobacterium crusticola]